MDELEYIPSDGPIENPEISEATSTPEPPPPEAPPPPKKKKLSEDRLTKLAKARARASEVAKEKRERKTRPSDDPIVAVEQDESDEDQFEGPPGLLGVRRKRAKGKTRSSGGSHHQPRNANFICFDVRFAIVLRWGCWNVRRRRGQRRYLGLFRARRYFFACNKEG